MKIKRAWSITKRIFWGMTHEKKTIALIFIAPIMAMFLFGLAFSGDVKDVKVVVVNNDPGFESFDGAFYSIPDTILSNIEAGVLDIQYATNEAQGEQIVRDGKAYALIVFPDHMTEDLIYKMNNSSYEADTTIKLRLDKTIFNVATTIAQTFIQSLMKTVKSFGQELPIKFDMDNAIYGKDAKFMDFFVPGVMGFAAFFLTALLTIISFIAERKNGTLARLLTTPAKPSEIVTGYAIFFGIVGMIQSLLLIGIAVTVFQIHIEGNLLLAFGAVTLLSLASLSFGILLSAAAHSEMQAVQMIPLIVLPTFLLAGIFWPVEAIPSWLRPLSYIIPPYYAIDACRSIMIRGWGIDRVWPNFVILFGFAAVFLLAASMSLKKSKA